MRRTKWFGATVALPLLFVLGCGSGGGSGAALSGGGGVVDVFVTDTFRDDFRQVLVTVFAIEGSTDGVTFQTLFNDATGQTINVAALADAAVLLARVGVANTSFTQLRVTIGDTLTLVRPGGASSSVPLTDTVGTAAGEGRRAITFSVTPDGSGNVVVDFDLAQFQMVGGRVRPVLHGGDPTEFRGRRRMGRPPGTVTNLVDGASFDLQGRAGRTIHVVLNELTTVTGSDGNSVTLANGQRVFVEGELDASGNLVATSVRIDERAEQPAFQAARGTVAGVTGDSFTLTVEHAHHFASSSGTITVVTDANTEFRRGRGASLAIADVTAGATVLVGGSFDEATQTLTARFVHLR